MGKSNLIAQFHWTDSVICSHFREGKTPLYSRINTLISGPPDGELVGWLFWV